MAPHKKQKSKRRFPRVLEAFIVLAALLVAHQALWLLFDRYIINQTRDWLTGQAGVPDRAIYLKPEGITKLPTPAYYESFETKEPSVRVIGIAPPRHSIVPIINEIEQPGISTSSGRFQFLLGPLRRGANEVTARLIEGPEERFPYQAARQHYTYRPSPLEPLVLSVSTRDDLTKIVGLGEPESTVFYQMTSGGSPPAPQRAYTNDVGLFTLPVKKPTAPLDVTVALTEEGLQKVSAQKVKLFPNQEGEIVSEPAASYARQILLSIPDDEHYSFTLNMGVPPKTAIYEWVEKKQISARELARRVFGLDCGGPHCPLMVNRDVLPIVTDQGIQLTVSGQTNELGFDLSLNNGAIPVLELAGDSVKLKLGNGQRGIGLSPEWLQEDHETWAWTTASPNYSFVRVAPIQNNANAPQSPAAPRLENLGDYLRALERRLPESLELIFRALLAAIPYLFLLWFLRDAKLGYATTLRSATAGLLLFHLTILSLPVFSSSFSVIRDALGWVPGDAFQLYGRKIDRSLVDDSLIQVGRIYPVLAIGVSALLLPIYKSYKRRPPVMTKRKRILWNFILRPFLWVAIAITPLFLFGFFVYAALESAKYRYASVGEVPPPNLTSWLGMAGIVALLSAFLMWFFLYWLLRISLGRPVKRWSVLKASWAMILLPLVPPLVETVAAAGRYLIITRKEVYPFFIPRHLDQWLWLLIIPIMGAIVLFQVTYLAIRLSLQRRPLRFYRSRRGKWLLLALFIFLSLPIRYVIGQQMRLGIWDLTALAYDIDGLLVYVLLVGLLVYLHQLNVKDSFDLPPQAKSVGVLLFAFYLTGRTANLLFVPIPFLLGWWIFGKWVLTKPADHPIRSSIAEMKILVRRVLDYRAALNLTYDVRKISEKKYSSGDITLEQMKTRIAESDENLAQAKQDLPVELKNSRGAIFEYGPEKGPWHNAALAVGYGLIISIPFQAITLSKIFASRTFGPFPILTVLRDILFTASFWVLAAFVFGYFFHLIRGRDGFRKALVYSVALIVPTIPLRLIQAEPILGQGYLIQMVQIFAYMLVLALVAFDLRTLVNLGYTWRDLISVHGFSTITGYVSSIALTTVASVTGKDLVGAIWGYVKGAFRSV